MAKTTFHGDERPRFTFDVAVEQLYRAQGNLLMEDLLDESGEFDQKKWDSLGVAPRRGAGSSCQ